MIPARPGQHPTNSEDAAVEPIRQNAHPASTAPVQGPQPSKSPAAASTLPPVPRLETSHRVSRGSHLKQESYTQDPAPSILSHHVEAAPPIPPTQSSYLWIDIDRIRVCNIKSSRGIEFR
jgi:hypothetical protein